MQVTVTKTRGLRGAALAALLLGLGACSKEQEPAPAAPAPQAAAPGASAPRVAAQGARLQEQAAPEEPPPPEPPPEPEPENTEPLPKDFAPGQPREVVLRMLGECAERVHYVPPLGGNLMVEVVQPKEGECRARLGDRRLMLVGGVLKDILPGAQPPPPPSPPVRDGV